MRKVLHEYRAPTVLNRSGHGIARALLIGSCTVVHTSGFFKQDYGIDTEFVHINSLSTFDFDSLPGNFDFQVINLPADHIMQRHEYFREDLNDAAIADSRFRRACDTVTDLLSCAMALNTRRGLTTFVCNFMVPQQNPQGRLLPRYDLRNPVYFVEQVNRHLSEELSGYKNAYLIDIDSLAATFGRIRIQDDAIWALSHGGSFTDLDYEIAQKFIAAGHSRVEPVGRIEEETFAERDLFWRSLCHELVAAYCTVRQRDQVKLVVVDLDDTLWRGVAADSVIDDPFDMLEGLPFGLIEALLFLESRGIALAIVSKNDAARILEIWKNLLERYIPLEKFVSVKINWDSKADNISAIARDLNIGLESVVFVDDHPREREEVSIRLPAVRVLGADVYGLRRDLLWSPETQVRAITAESARKTGLFKQQIARELLRQGSTREEFLSALNLHVGVQVISTANTRGFDRAVELINKTNQFNTTGVRFSTEQIVSILHQKGYVVAFSAADKTTDYGIIASAVVLGNRIETFVMSCRVIGLDVEIAALRKLEDLVRGFRSTSIEALTAETDRNLLSRDLFKRGGYLQDGSIWRRELAETLPLPAHIVVDEFGSLTSADQADPNGNLTLS